MEDLHLIQRILHIFFFNLFVFALFYLAFAPRDVGKVSTNQTAQPLRAASK